MSSDFIGKEDMIESVTKYQQRKKLCEEVDFLENKGGANWIINGLHTNVDNGIDPSSIDMRKQKYGSNEREKIEIKTFCQLACEALNDYMLIIMCIAGVANIIINMIMEKDHRSTAWIEGFAILLAVAIVVIVQAVNDLKKEKEFQKLNEEVENGKRITIVRNGQDLFLNNSEVVVGDIVRLKGGMEIAGDGILLQGYNVQIDESSMTGETDPIHKATIDECVKKRNEIQSSGKTGSHGIHDVPTPIMMSGTKVLGGSGIMVVTTVGKDCAIGKIKALVEDGEPEATPLQLKLEKIARDIGIFGLISAVLLFTALMIRFIVENSNKGWEEEALVYVREVLEFFLIAITILIVAIPEGLPLAVTLSLAFSVQKMMKENNLVRRLQACETMGGANIICSDKTGTLTENKMYLTNFWNKKSFEVYNSDTKESLDYNQFMTNDASKVFENVIALNSSEDPAKEEGNPTEQATLKYLHRLGFPVVSHRESHPPVFVADFSSDRKRSSVIIKLNNRLYVFMKGASEWMLDVSDNFLDLSSGEESNLDFELKNTIEKAIETFATKSLRTIGLCYKEISEEEMDTETIDKKGIYNFEKDGFTLVGICGIKDILKAQVPEAVLKCHKAGIDVKMVTGDNKITAEAIANDCKIINSNNKYRAIVMEGKDFMTKIGGIVCDHCRDKEECDCVRNEKDLAKKENKNKKVRKDSIRNQKEFDKLWKNLAVLARSRPEDKYALVVGLRERGNVVAVTGDGTNDAPALSKADVGFAMNIAGTEVAKQAADILLLDDNFSSIITAAKWGRNIYDAIKKFLQFQLTVNVVAVLTTFVSSVILKESILSAVQMLWINLIMDTLAALALATEPPREELLDRLPHKKSEYIITPLMIKHILGQAVFQTILLLVVVFAGEHFLFELFRESQQMPNSILIIQGRREDGYDKSKLDNEFSIHFTYIFNIFVMLQFFNFLNCRMLLDEPNIFKEIGKSTLLLFILLIIFILQIIFLTFFGTAIRVHTWGLGPAQWGLCIGIGLFSLLVRFILIFIPLEKCCTKGVGNKELPIDQLNSKSSISIKRSHTQNFYSKQPGLGKKGSKVIS
jgi:Ca2+ transporting ATPase